MDKTLSQLGDELAAEQATLERELVEIEMLLSQAAAETERHEARRLHAEQQTAELERANPPSSELAEAHTQLVAQTRRQTLMQAQLEVLSGKQRAVQRFRDRLAELLLALRQASRAAGDGAGALAADRTSPAPRDMLAAQEELRRDIARKMHDGPAQSIANIALQAQVVQRLVERQPKEAQAELNELVRMVEHALEATKDFIFDVRPMVLDDLGLVPTLRRSALERGRRAGLPVRFESVGADRRLRSEDESAIFRVIDDALVGYLSARPPELAVTLDWSADRLRAVVHASTTGAEQPEASRAHAAVAAARHERTMPAALASMIREQEHDATLRSTGLPETVWQEISSRAISAGLDVKLSSDRSTLEVAAPARA